MELYLKTKDGQYFSIKRKLDANQQSAAKANKIDELTKVINDPLTTLKGSNNWRELISKLFHRPPAPNLTDLEAKKQLIQELKRQTISIVEAPPNGIPAKTTHSDSGGNKGAKGGASKSSSTPPPPQEAQAKDKEIRETPESVASEPSDDGAVQNSEPSEGNDATVEDCPKEGEPISMVTGEELLQLTDCQLPGPIPLQFTRTYRSSKPIDSGLGVGWSHTLCAHIKIENTGQLKYFDDENRCIVFKLPRIGQRSKYLPEGLNLDRPSSTQFILKQEGEWDKVFSLVGDSTHYRLTQIRHHNYQTTRSVIGAQQSAGYAIDVFYNEQNRVIRMRGNWGKSFLFARNNHGQIKTITLQNDLTETRKILATYDYSSDGDLISAKNANNVGEIYQYQNHLIQQRTLKTGFNFYFEWDGTDHKARCIRNWGDHGIYSYKFNWSPDEKRSEAIDSRGYTRQYRYNEYGQVSEENDNEGHTHQYEFEKGRKTAYINPLGERTEYAYARDSGSPTQIRDALGNKIVLGYFQGKLKRIIDKDKGCWEREYDKSGKLIKLINPLKQETRYNYNSQGLVRKITGPDQLSTIYNWSEFGELTSIVDPAGHIQKFTYDDWGQVTSSELVIGGKQSAGHVRYQYSPTGMIQKVTTAHGEVHDYYYNDNDQLIRYSDPKGRTTQYKYDGLSQVVERIDAEGQRLKYEYDTERNLIALVNENGERYRFEYDGNERLIREIGFDNREQRYEYNSAGYLIKHIDSGEVVTYFKRDALGQLIGKGSRKIGDKSALEISRFAYDPKGRLKYAENTHQKLAFIYNPLGQIQEERQKLAGSQTVKNISYQFNDQNALVQLSLPGAQHINYAYDTLGHLNTIQYNDKNITEINRDALGREVLRKQGELSTQSNYDPFGRLCEQSSFNQQTKAPGPIHRKYNYDQFGNLQSLTDGGSETRYIYDLVDRLKRVEGATPETFSFDPASNLLAISEGKNKQTGHTKGNRLLVQGDRKFSYDARGNLIKENRGKGGKLETTYQYNAQNQLIKITRDGQSTEYQYDPLGRRIKKQDAFGSTEFLWAGDQLIQEKRKGFVKQFIYEPLSFKPVAMVQNDEVYHYHLDHIGTPQELSNEQGDIVWKARYKTYGNVAFKEVEEVDNPLRFQGQYFDDESGLHYNRHRYYDPASGQFVTQDPIGLLGGVNNYQYAPNPIGWVDPFGLSSKDCTSPKNLNPWNQFLKDTKGQFSSVSEASKVYQKNKLARADTVPGSVSAEAQDWQGKGAYYGVDKYEDVVIPAGTIIYGGAPGQSSYYTPQETLDQLGPDSKAIFQALQVGSYKGTYRPGLTAYVVKEDIVVAQGVTLANPQFGSGGAQQYYIPEDTYKTKLAPLSTTILENTKA